MGERDGGHEQVVTSLMDLQARLRGEKPQERRDETRAPEEPTATEPVAVEEVVRLPDADELPAPPEEPMIGVGATPEPQPVEDAVAPVLPVEVAAIETADVPEEPEEEEEVRFAPVTPLHAGVGGEDRFAGIVERIASLESSIGEVSQRVDRREDERNERLISLEQRLLHEVASQRRDLLAAVDDRFVELDTALRRGLAALHAELPDLPSDEGEPA